MKADEKIVFPSGYIRTVAFFNAKYHLNDLFPNWEKRNNIAYALEVSDLLNYLMNRFNLWGPVITVLYKLAIVNLVSIMEALLLEAANNICSKASTCKRTTSCKNHLSKDERNNARKAVEKLNLIGVLDLSADQVSRIQDIIELRNRIHIRLAAGNELRMRDFTLELYNEVIGFLQLIDTQLFENGFPRYFRC